MEFTAPIELNFKPEHKNEIFNLPMDRALQIADELDAIVDEFTANEEQWTIKGTGEYEGKTRLDEGAMLEKMISIAKNVNEWAFILYSANPLFDNVKLRWDIKRRRSFGNGLAEAIAEVINKVL